MRILLLNQFVPPEGAPTARLLGELADEFRGRGHEVVLIGAGRDYRKSGTCLRARLIRDLKAHLLLAWGTLTAGRADWVLCLSDPPGLPFTAALLAKWKGARFAHWAMDVYPEVAVALGALPEGLPKRLIGRAMKYGYRQAELLAALDEDMSQRIAKGRHQSVNVCPPWPPLPPPDASVSEALKQIRISSPNGRIWLYSGNLGRAHEYSCLLHAQKELEESESQWHLVFQGGGPCRADAEQMAAELGLKRCHWLPYAADTELIDSLCQANVLIATQKPQTKGMLWPSKLALMMLLNRPIGWVGPVDGSIARDVVSIDGSAVFAPEDHKGLSQWLQQIPQHSDRLNSTELDSQIHNLREQGLRQWSEWISADT